MVTLNSDVLFYFSERKINDCSKKCFLNIQKTIDKYEQQKSDTSFKSNKINSYTKTITIH